MSVLAPGRRDTNARREEQRQHHLEPDMLLNPPQHLPHRVHLLLGSEGREQRLGADLVRWRLLVEQLGDKSTARMGWPSTEAGGGEVPVDETGLKRP